MIGGVAFGRFFGLYFPVPGMWAVIGFVCYPGCGVLLGCFVGCARMRVLGVGFFLWFDWFFVLVVPVCG